MESMVFDRYALFCHFLPENFYLEYEIVSLGMQYRLKVFVIEG